MPNPLAISLAGLRRDDPEAPWAAGPRAAIVWAGSLGLRAVQLDGAAPGMRARELDRSARRDIGALLRRAELQFTGLDLWLPGEHLLEAAHVDRAVAAIAGAIGLAAELAPLAGGTGRLVSLTLPARLGGDVLHQIGTEADLHGVRIADHAWPPGPHLPPRQATVSPPGPAPVHAAPHGNAPPIPAAPAAVAAPPASPAWPPMIGVGLDPAAVALAGESIAAAAARTADRLLSARLCDLSSAGRVLPGSADGRLDLLAYRVSLSLAPAATPVVIDLRGLQEQDVAARRMLADWQAGAL